MQPIVIGPKLWWKAKFGAAGCKIKRLMSKFVQGTPTEYSLLLPILSIISHLGPFFYKIFQVFSTLQRGKYKLILKSQSWPTESKNAIKTFNKISWSRQKEPLFWRFQKSFGPPEREYSVGVPCTNFAISLLILHPAAPNLACHHYLGCRTIDRRDF